MAEIEQKLKRKNRRSKSSGSESDICSPDGKKVFVSSLYTTLSESDISEAPLDESDQEYKALKMSGKIEKQLQQILNRLDSMEKKLQKVEGVLAQISGLEKSVNDALKEVTTLNEKTKRMEKNIQELETGLTSTNTDVTDMEGRQKQTLEKIKSLEDQILYQDVYSRRENLRFFWAARSFPRR